MHAAVIGECVAAVVVRVRHLGRIAIGARVHHVADGADAQVLAQLPPDGRRVRAEAVGQVDRLAEDVRERLVQGPRLTLVDEPRAVVGDPVREVVREVLRDCAASICQLCKSTSALQALPRQLNLIETFSNVYLFI